MKWFDWFLIAWMTFGALSTVASVGKPRQPIEPATAVGTVVITGALIVGLLITRGAL